MPEMRFPAPSDDQRAFLRDNPLILKNGEVLGFGSGFINVCTCMQHSHAKRKIGSICAELIIRHYCTAESVDQLEAQLRTADHEGRIAVNYKSFNILRAAVLAAQGTSTPGGKASPADLAAYHTIKKAIDEGGGRAKFFASVMCIHDGCTADRVGTSIGWEDAIRHTYHDLWRSNVGDVVDLFVADVQTKDSTVRSMRLLDTFDRTTYIEAMQNRTTIWSHLPGNQQFISWPFIPLAEEVWTGDLYQQIALNGLVEVEF